jgi:hypothetical protein
MGTSHLLTLDVNEARVGPDVTKRYDTDPVFHAKVQAVHHELCEAFPATKGQYGEALRHELKLVAVLAMAAAEGVGVDPRARWEQAHNLIRDAVIGIGVTTYFGEDSHSRHLRAAQARRLFNLDRRPDIALALSIIEQGEPE